jgi:DNA-binding MarR family transcriptional regulator
MDRALNRRHLRALVYLAVRDAQAVSRGALLRAVGRYATNTIISLEERQLVEYNASRCYELTDSGRRLVDELREEFAALFAGKPGAKNPSCESGRGAT